MNKILRKYISELKANSESIATKRKDKLSKLAANLVGALQDNEMHASIFVCTHNSRRSHLADLWFRLGLMHYGMEGLESFSGGTEATAFNERAIAAMRRAGFEASYDNKAQNPIVTMSPLIFVEWNVWSKAYSDDANPKTNFTAVMVCSEADEACPVVLGATQRFALPFNDPKEYDGTPLEEQKYDEAVKLIGTEMMFLVGEMKGLRE